jgi:hypothetical protein
MRSKELLLDFMDSLCVVAADEDKDATVEDLMEMLEPKLTALTDEMYRDYLDAEKWRHFKDVYNNRLVQKAWDKKGAN